MEVSGHLHALAASPLGKGPLVPTGYEAGWAPELVCPTINIISSYQKLMSPTLFQSLLIFLDIYDDII
jgi:hypothetical protein